MGWDGICVYMCVYIERESTFFRREKQKGAAVIEEAATPPLSLPAPAAVGVRFHNPLPSPGTHTHALAKHTPYSYVRTCIG